jgi:hypothetical protein
VLMVVRHKHSLAFSTKCGGKSSLNEGLGKGQPFPFFVF